MILTTEQIVELLRSRGDVHIVDGDKHAVRVSVDMLYEDAKKFTIIINNTNVPEVKRMKAMQKAYDDISNDIRINGGLFGGNS